MPHTNAPGDDLVIQDCDAFLYGARRVCRTLDDPNLIVDATTERAGIGAESWQDRLEAFLGADFERVVYGDLQDALREAA